MCALISQNVENDSSQAEKQELQLSSSCTRDVMMRTRNLLMSGTILKGP